MGRIADIAQSIVPIEWDALSNDSRIGDPALTARETYVQSLLFGDMLSEVEQDALNNLVAEFAGTMLAIQAIDIGIDFWMVQSEIETTEQPREVVNYPERLDHLRELKMSLLAKLAKLEPIVTPLIPDAFERAQGSAPLVSSFDAELLTPNPQDFGPIYAPPET